MSPYPRLEGSSDAPWPQPPLLTSPASSLCSGLSSEPGHCLPFFDAAPLSFVEFEHLALRWYKFPRWSLWFPWQDPAERFWHCQPSLYRPNYQLHKGERSVPRFLIMKDPAASPPRLRLRLQPGPSPTAGPLVSSEPLRTGSHAPARALPGPGRLHFVFWDGHACSRINLLPSSFFITSIFSSLYVSLSLLKFIFWWEFQFLFG